MEYKIHKCCDQSCDCFEIIRVMHRIKLVTFYQVYNAVKEAYVFSFSYIRNYFEGRIYRRAKRFIGKALPPNTDHSSDTQGIPQPWSQAPPLTRNTFRIFHKANLQIKSAYHSQLLVVMLTEIRYQVW